AILPPSADASPKSPHQTETAAAIAAVDPTVRMTLRRNPVILAAILSDLTVRALTIVDKAHAARARARARDRILAGTRDLTLDLDRDLTRVLALALELDLDRRHVLALARTLARHLAGARD